MCKKKRISIYRLLSLFYLWIIFVLESKGFHNFPRSHFRSPGIVMTPKPDLKIAEMSRVLLELQQELIRMRIEQKKAEKAHMEALVEEHMKYSKEVERLERRIEADGVSRERAKDSSSTSFVATPSLAAPVFVHRDGKVVVDEPRGTQPMVTGFPESGEKDQNPFRSWENIKARMMKQFTAENDTSTGERLMTLRQTGSVKKFFREFIALAANAPELQDTTLELAFMVGLRPSICARMKSFSPRHLDQMMSVAKTVAEWDLAVDESPTSHGAFRSGSNKSGGPHGPAGSRSLNGPNQDRRNPKSHNRVKSAYRRLTQTEMAERKAASLCFRCDERWHSRHTCTKKELLVLIAQPDGADRVWEDDDVDDSRDDVGDMTVLAALSLNSLVGILSPNTMKLEGQILGETVVVMNDSSASHNFIDYELVRRLGIPLVDTLGYGVVTGTGVTVQGQGKCQKTTLTVQGLRIHTNFLPLQLGGADVILGMQWLTSVGDMKCNWGLQVLRFLVAGYELVTRNITLEPSARPVTVRPFRYPHIQKEELEKHVVRKKDGSWRLCVDYKALNKVTVGDSFPISMIDQLLDELNGAAVFSKLDLRSGYHQILVKAADVPKTAFHTHDGHYEFLVMPFGLTNAPATFQSVMNDVFRKYLRKFVLVFFDDILVYSRTLAEHKDHLQTVLQTVLQLLADNQMFANKNKCQFGSAEVEYLGHVITQQGVAADPSKIKAMTDWPVPKTIKALRGFLGLTGYYRKFVRGYGNIVKPLTSLLKKDKFGWSEEAEQAFEALKPAMSTVPVLALADFSELFVVESDASGIGLGAVLMQQQKPIALFSQALTDIQKLKSVYERELMAIVFAIQKWRHYLLGCKFLVITDQKSLKFLLEQREVNLEYQKWLTKILGFDFDIHYKPRLENKAADALSRVEAVPHLFALSVPEALQLKEIDREVEQNPELGKLKLEVIADPTAHDEFTVVNGRLLRNGRLVLPKESPMVKLILQEFHDGKVGGHGGIHKTQKRIGDMFFWRGMMTDIKEYVAACQVCQRHKYSTLAPAGLLQPLPIPADVWEDTSMDFIKGLPKSEGFSVIMVVVERITKYSHFISLKHPYEASMVVQIFIQEIVRLHGFPKTIVSDRDKTFTGRLWKEVFRLSGTKLNFNTAYHPQSDGQTEVTNMSVETFLRCFCSEKPNKWVQFLAWAEMSYNSSFHSATKMSPFKVVYGREAHTLLKFENGSTDNADLDLGDLVFLKLRPYIQQSLARRVNDKLFARFLGPFAVEARVGAVAYKLTLPPDAKIHHTFHVSQLKAAVGSSLEAISLPPQLSMEEILEAEPELILGERVHAKSGQLEVLVKWKGLHEQDSTWEWKGVIEAQFPDFHLEDKVCLNEGSNVTCGRPPLLFQYRRKKNKQARAHKEKASKEEAEKALSEEPSRSG
ncbi:hypothetical protein AALP_AA3G264600 [Arabis alpina]|uniref:Reverse transcriptase n=1 Tax=Arabis alpina TaxID=50452 RepID=A0A087HBU4_ARAAL|nr:hypothetical protein AALP_AA3G264600 [Arabis alpina]